MLCSTYLANNCPHKKNNFDNNVQDASNLTKPFLMKKEKKSTVCRHSKS